MAERAASRPWTEQEDSLLRNAVAHYGDNDNWKIIASSVPGRTNKACRKRWLHSLQPNVKKSAWIPDEDQLLLDFYDKFGPKWSVIARHIPGRTDDACSKRYRESLDPNLKKDEWTREEETKLMEAYNLIGCKWGKVGQELQRSGLACRNRWRLLERKIAKANQDSSPSQATSINESASFRITGEDASPAIIVSDLSPYSQPIVVDTIWPPYYPPEAYTMLNSADEHAIDRPFQAPDSFPELINPEVAPFQFSSSSLSAALSDPPRPPRPLPPHSTTNTPELFQDNLEDLSPLSQLPDMQDILMSPDDVPFDSQLQVAISQPPFETDSIFMPFPGGFSYISPISVPIDISQDHLIPEMWKLRPTEHEFDSPHSIFEGLSNFTDAHEGLSSSPSTPFFQSNSLSPTSSPNPVSLVDLPNAELPSPGSLLFSPADGTQFRRPQKKNSARKHRTSPMQARLSSSLSLSSNHKPYACGACWPIGQETSSSCFATSGELQDHVKQRHTEEECSDKPYKCALTGCGKSWKSLNGLQYHLQISATHFTSALHDKFSKQPATPIQQMSLLSTEGESEDPDRRYPCPRPDCYKAYRQPSGLRYHLKHGHPLDLPTQLNIVPPALERQLPAMAKRMRPKPLIDSAGLQLEQPIATTS